MKRNKSFDVPFIRFATAIAAVCVLTVAGCALSGPDAVVLSDAQITNEVKSGLSADSSLDSYTINVTTKDATVHLTGAVATGAERDTAERIAKRSRGVAGVDNYIQFGKAALSNSAATP
jgi:osmotically-inducible protein OsmY